jgi:choice-of-anchor B domain-containing protein
MRTKFTPAGALRLAAVLPLALPAVLIADGDEDAKVLTDPTPYFGEILRGPLPAGVDFGFDADGIEFLSQIPINQFPGGSSGANDVWGYVSPSGREYALVGLECGFGFAEVTDPNNPVVIGYVASRCSTWKDIKVYGEYAYGVSDQRGRGIHVVDLRDVDNGNVTLVQDWSVGGQTTAHNIVANEDSGFVYLVGGNISNGGLAAYDVGADPESPPVAGGWGDMYIHDAQVVTYTSGPYAGKEIAFALGGFNNGWSDTGLRIVDVTDKGNMTLLGEERWTNAGYAHQGWLSEDRQYFYVNDELDEDNFGIPTTTRIFDVSDLSNPTFVTSFTNGLPVIDHNNYVHDGMLFQANYRAGLRVWDLEDPVAPEEIAYFDTQPQSNATDFNGTWSVYPYLPSGTLLLNDREKGLYVLRMESTGCYPDCDTTSGAGVLDVFDFLCFQDKFVSADPYADCDGNSTFDVFDFLCFQDAFTTGCP